jgi:hypothetical protein
LSKNQYKRIKEAFFKQKYIFAKLITKFATKLRYDFKDISTQEIIKKSKKNEKIVSLLLL